MTPRTRSLYAYVGESHQPYQSPSKDLDMINGRISGRLPHVMGVQVLLLCSTFNLPASCLAAYACERTHRQAQLSAVAPTQSSRIVLGTFLLLHGHIEDMNVPCQPCELFLDTGAASL